MPGDRVESVSVGVVYPCSTSCRRYDECILGCVGDAALCVALAGWFTMDGAGAGAPAAFTRAALKRCNRRADIVLLDGTSDDDADGLFTLDTLMSGGVAGFPAHVRYPVQCWWCACLQCRPVRHCLCPKVSLVDDVRWSVCVCVSDACLAKPRSSRVAVCTTRLR